MINIIRRWYKKYYGAVIVIISVIGCIYVSFGDFGKRDGSSDSFARLQSIILYLTGMAIWWYSQETYELRKISESILLSSDQPTLVPSRHDTPENKQKFPDASGTYKNIGKGAALNVFVVCYKSGAFYSTSLDECFVAVEAGNTFPVKHMNLATSEHNILKTYTNLDDTILSKIKNSGHDDVRIVIYKDRASNSYYSLYIGKKIDCEMTSYGLLKHFEIKQS